MDLINDGGSIITEEDRISNLPDDITYHILSFMDMKYAVQTSILSRKWKHIWTLMPRFNLNSDAFCSLRRFDKFVVHALSHHNNLTEVSAVKLKIRGSPSQPLVTDIVNYAYLHNLRQLTITWSSGSQHGLPQCLFGSHTLKHLTFINQAFSSWNSCTPNSAWDFPALETLNLTSVRLGDGSEKNLNLFSKCVNLKDITLHRCCMKGLEIFNVCAPELSNLTITEASVLPKVFNIVAPQLETLTASASVSISTEGLASCSNFLHLSTAGFNALEKVNISMSNSRFKKERHVPSLLELFRTLHTVKFLILDLDIIKSLSSCLDQLSHEPCPFDNLKCLKINTTPLKQWNCLPTIPTEVRNYLLENSPNATFTMDLPQRTSVYQTLRNGNTNKQPSCKQYLDSSSLSDFNSTEASTSLSIDDFWTADSAGMSSTSRPAEDRRVDKYYVMTVKPGVSAGAVSLSTGIEVPQKRSREQIHSDPVTMKVAKLEAEEKLPGAMTEEKRMLEEKIHRQDQVIAQQKAKIQVQFQVNEHQMAKIQTQDQLIAQQKAKIQMQDQVIAQQKAKIQMQDQVIAQKAKIQMQDQVIAQQKAKIQMQDQIIVKHKTMFMEKIKKQGKLVAKQKTVFEAEMQSQDQDIAKLKDMLVAQNLQHEKLVSQIIKFKMAELKAQVESGNPDFEVIRLVGRDIISAIDLIPQSLRVNVEEEFYFQYEALKCFLLTRIDASQWARIETVLGNIRHSEGVHSSHIQSHDHAAELPPPPRQSPANMITSSRLVSAGSNQVVQPSQSAHMQF